MSVEYSALVQSRAASCALAAMMGDALGAAYEGHSFKDIQAEAPALGCREHKSSAHMGVYNHGERSGCYTDDTNSAVAILKSAVALGRIDAGDIAYRHARQWIDGFSLGFLRGYPGSAQAMMLETLKGSDAHACATISFKDGSYANGAAMKVWPIAIAMHDKTRVSAEEFYEAVRASCAYSHIHPQAVDSAVSLAETIRWAIHYKEGELAASASATSGGDVGARGGGIFSSWSPNVDGAELLRVAHEACLEENVKDKVGQLRAAYDKFFKNRPRYNGELTEEGYKKEVVDLHNLLGNICGTSVKFQIEGWSALVCALAVAARHGPNVEDVIAFSVGVGGDTDTVASMAGAISGALRGGNPQEWCDKAVWEGLENGRGDAATPLVGRDWIIESAVQLAKQPNLKEIRFPKPGQSASAAAPRSVVDAAAEICGKFWSNPMQSQGFDHFREDLYNQGIISEAMKEQQDPSSSSNNEAIQRIIPMMFNKVDKTGGITEAALTAFSPQVMESKEAWMKFTDPQVYKK